VLVGGNNSIGRRKISQTVGNLEERERTLMWWRRGGGGGAEQSREWRRSFEATHSQTKLFNCGGHFKGGGADGDGQVMAARPRSSGWRAGKKRPFFRVLEGGKTRGVR